MEQIVVWNYSIPKPINGWNYLSLIVEDTIIQVQISTINLSTFLAVFKIVLRSTLALNKLKGSVLQETILLIHGKQLIVDKEISHRDKVQVCVCYLMTKFWLLVVTLDSLNVTIILLSLITILVMSNRSQETKISLNLFSHSKFLQLVTLSLDPYLQLIGRIWPCGDMQMVIGLKWFNS